MQTHWFGCRNPAPPWPLSFYFNLWELFRRLSQSFSSLLSLIDCHCLLRAFSFPFFSNCLPAHCPVFDSYQRERQQRGFPSEARAKRQACEKWFYTSTLGQRNAGLHPPNYTLHLELEDVYTPPDLLFITETFLQERDWQAAVYFCQSLNWNVSEAVQTSGSWILCVCSFKFQKLQGSTWIF